MFFRYKSLEEIEDAGVEVMADEFPDKPTDFIDNGDGTWYVQNTNIWYSEKICL